MGINKDQLLESLTESMNRYIVIENIQSGLIQTISTGKSSTFKDTLDYLEKNKDKLSEDDKKKFERLVGLIKKERWVNEDNVGEVSTETRGNGDSKFNKGDKDIPETQQNLLKGQEATTEAVNYLEELTTKLKIYEANKRDSACIVLKGFIECIANPSKMTLGNVAKLSKEHKESLSEDEISYLRSVYEVFKNNTDIVCGSLLKAARTNSA